MAELTINDFKGDLKIKKINLLINFSTLKIGGGQNVAMNFLYEVEKLDTKSFNIFYFVASRSQPYYFLKEMGKNNFKDLPTNPIKRILFEIFFSKKFLKEHKIHIIYSMFGYGLFSKNYTNFGRADSNIFFLKLILVSL